MTNAVWLHRSRPIPKKERVRKWNGARPGRLRERKKAFRKFCLSRTTGSPCFSERRSRAYCHFDLWAISLTLRNRNFGIQSRDVENGHFDLLAICRTVKSKKYLRTRISRSWLYVRARRRFEGWKFPRRQKVHRVILETKICKLEHDKIHEGKNKFNQTF